MEKLVQTPEGRNDVERMFKLCDPLDGDSISISYFMTTATRYLSDAVLNDFKRQKVDQICKKLLQHAGEKTPIQRYSLVLNMLMGERKHSCIQSNFLKYSESLNSTITFLALHYGKIELYQHCNEFGWFRTSNEKSIFSKNIDLTYFLKLCSQTFGFSVNKNHIETAVTKTNNLYGGMKINTPRILFVNGEADLWRFAQIKDNKENKNLEVITISGGSHCSDIHHANSKKREMVKAIKEIKSKLDVWLKH